MMLKQVTTDDKLKKKHLYREEKTSSSSIKMADAGSLFDIFADLL